MSMRCRHHKAWPTIYGAMGFMWCPDCGAIREIRKKGDGNSYEYSEPYWVRPRSHHKDMERNRAGRVKWTT